MEEEVRLVELFGIVKNHFVTIVSSGLIGLIIASVITFFIAAPQYSSTTNLLVNRTRTEAPIQQTDIDTNVQLISTYKEIIKEPVILDEVREELGLEKSHDELSSEITIGNEEGSQVFSLVVTNEDPYTAALIANAVADSFQQNIDEIMDVDNVRIMSEAAPDMQPVSPNMTVNLLIGLLLGLMIGFTLALISELLDNRVKDERFAKEQLGWTNLGTISRMTENELQSVRHMPKHQVKEFHLKSRI